MLLKWWHASLHCLFFPYVLMLLCVFCKFSYFDNWTFILEQPDSCAATSFGMSILKYTLENWATFLNKIFLSHTFKL